MRQIRYIVSYINWRFRESVCFVVFNVYWIAWWLQSSDLAYLTTWETCKECKSEQGSISNLAFSLTSEYVWTYRQTSNTSCTKSQNIKVARLFFQLFYSIHWSQVLSREWRCIWSSADMRCLNYIREFHHIIAYSDAPYIVGLTENFW